jgi:hypothetical protein
VCEFTERRRTACALIRPHCSYDVRALVVELLWLNPRGRTSAVESSWLSPRG